MVRLDIENDQPEIGFCNSVYTVEVTSGTIQPNAA